MSNQNTSTINAMETKEDQQPSPQPSCLTISKNTIKSRSSNCLMDPTIGPWLPGISLTAQAHTVTPHEWISGSPRLSRDDGGSSNQSNSNFEQWRKASDKQMLKGSSVKRKKRGAKKQKNSGNVEDGKDDELSPLGRKIIVFVAVSLFLLCILLVGVTLRLGPVIDEMAPLNSNNSHLSIENKTNSPSKAGHVNLLKL
ncbi:hypothetical protein JTE90_003794 [Oedothorax gibbosus]|uniref:Uncharacterized protein n=1 Tax=Oedothorax gibbosus TaxID=931172 RepID=A0AAV6V9M1_9ARAC|nr:hypothetical protein JTE90_003794 [Oedothorax gibbosus]